MEFNFPKDWVPLAFKWDEVFALEYFEELIICEVCETRVGGDVEGSKGLLTGGSDGCNADEV